MRNGTEAQELWRNKAYDEHGEKLWIVSNLGSTVQEMYDELNQQKKQRESARAERESRKRDVGRSRRLGLDDGEQKSRPARSSTATGPSAHRPTSPVEGKHPSGLLAPLQDALQTWLAQNQLPEPSAPGSVFATLNWSTGGQNFYCVFSSSAGNTFDVWVEVPAPAAGSRAPEDDILMMDDRRWRRLTGGSSRPVSR